MKRFVLMLILALAAYTTAQAAVTPFGPSGPIQVRRGWGAVTGALDSTQFLLHGTTDGTASGRGRDTLNLIDISNWDRSPFPGQAGIAAVVGHLWVTFGGGGTLGDSIGIELRFSNNGTDFTAIRTLAWYVTSTAATVAAIPIVFDADAHVSAATGDLGSARYMQVIFAGDSAGKQVVSSVYESHYDIRQRPSN